MQVLPSYSREETLCPLNSVHVALMFCFLGSKVCGVENLPPLHGRSVMAGVDVYRLSILKVEVHEGADLVHLK